MEALTQRNHVLDQQNAALRTTASVLRATYDECGREMLSLENQRIEVTSRLKAVRAAILELLKALRIPDFSLPDITEHNLDQIMPQVQEAAAACVARGLQPQFMVKNFPYFQALPTYFTWKRYWDVDFRINFSAGFNTPFFLSLKNFLPKRRSLNRSWKEKIQERKGNLMDS